MTRAHIATINTTALLTCLLAILSGIGIGALGIWDVIPASTGLLWRALGTCGLLFAGSISASLAIRCFKTNE